MWIDGKLVLESKGRKIRLVTEKREKKARLDFNKIKRLQKVKLAKQAWLREIGDFDSRIQGSKA